MKNNRVTITDLAQELNVSPSTVSRALQDSHQIGLETKQSVWALAKKRNYVPNLLAKRLINQKSFTVGVIVPEVSYYFNAAAIRGIEDVLLAKGYNLLICQTHESYEQEVFHCNNLVSSQVDGIISSISGTTRDLGHFYQVREQGLPIVFFDRGYNVPNISKVMIDNVEAARVATQHLIGVGCRRIAYLNGPNKMPMGHARKKGYLQALQEAGLPHDPKLVMHCKLGGDLGYAQAKTLLQQKPDGIFTINDRVAMAALSAIRHAGLNVPNDIAVIGFNDEPYAALLNPSLSTIEQPAFKMGREAARLFLQQLEQATGEVQTKILPTKLIVRESTKRTR